MKNKVLIDTAYLLPIFNIDISISDFDSLFLKLLDTYDVYYNPISLIEAKQIMLKLMKNDKENKEGYLNSYIKGLRTIIKDGRLKQTEITNPSIEELSDNLMKEIKNYYRRTIYATATHMNVLLLTESKKLLNYPNTKSIATLFEKR